MLARTLDDSVRVTTPVARADLRRRRGARGIPSRFEYRPALDGVRAFAVGAVLLYHAGEPWARGGYLGVDAFFVLSGFLITSLLVTEWSRSGTIDLKAFWIRRARRLLPALGLVLVGIAVYAAVFAPSDQLARIRADGLATIGYVANWRFVFSGQSYFDQFTQPSPFRHMWSLAIEEQFYLVWPLIVFGVLRWRRSVRALLTTCVALIVGSAVLMAVLFDPGRDPSRVYYGTDTRVQSLLIGAVAGVLLLRHGPIRTLPGRALLRVLAFAGAVCTLWLWSTASERSSLLYRGGFLLAACSVVAVIVSVSQPRRGALGAALSWRPIRWIGAISYGLYLWHWPIYLVLTRARTGVDGDALLALRLGVTFAFATASYYLIEMPIRRGRLHLRRPSVAVPVAVALLVAGLVISTTGGGPSSRAATLAALEHSAAPTVPPTSAGAAAAAPTKVLVLGDSVAATMGVGLLDVQDRDNLVVWDRGQLGCGLLRGGDVFAAGQVVAQSSTCDNWDVRWGSFVRAFDPDVVVLLVGAWDVFDRQINGEWLRLGTVEYDRYFLSELDQASSMLAAQGAKVVILTTPYFARPELVGSTPDAYNEYQPSRVDRINALFRDFSVRNPGRYTLLDLNRFVSPQGRFTDTLRGQLIRDDGVHFTKAGADMVAQWLAPKIQAVARGEDPDPASNTEQYDSRGLRWS